MTSRKRPAPEPLLPAHNSKQPRRALKGLNGEIASPSEAQGLLSKWLSLASSFYSLSRETAVYLIPTALVNTESQRNIGLHSQLPAPRPRKRLPSSTRIQETTMVPMVEEDEPLSPQNTLSQSDAQLMPPPPPPARLPQLQKAHQAPIHPPSSIPSSTQQGAPSSLPESNGRTRSPSTHDRHAKPQSTSIGEAAVASSSKPVVLGEGEQVKESFVASSSKRWNESYEFGIRRNYQNRPHILAKAHKAHVQAERTKDREELVNTLYEMKRASGYQSDFQTFKGYLQYGKLIDSLASRDALSTSPSLTDLRSAAKATQESRRHSYSNDETAFLQRAIEKARRTLSGPKPPPPFMPTFEKMKLTQRTKDDMIERRLRALKPVPSSLPPEDEERVKVLLKKQGVISRYAKEQVTDKDLSRLRPAQWLNDEIINFYGAMIMGRSEDNKENREKKMLDVHYFSTFFWAKLSKEGYEKGRLAKWTKKIDIFSKDVILIPVNHGNAHWTGAAINFRCKRIESYDSMGYKRDEVYRILRAYLDAEHRNKKKTPFDFTGWEDYFSLSTPQQENGFDCGVFTCNFLESISRGEDSFNFTQKDMPYLRRRMVWEIGHGALRDEP